jgi:hypothetical protein
METGMRRSGACAIACALPLLMWPAPAPADFQGDIEELTRGLPGDAAALIHRIVDCDHWSGEEPYDDARRAEIDKALRTLNCNGLAADEAALRQRYRTKPAVLDALTRARTLTD